ncbi:MAG: dihydrodipicolinate synthase family protein [Chloroflexi bacterium]|nr:dihydrodipicolinate synthase family protein [Chloroflexota bacterium]
MQLTDLRGIFVPMLTPLDDDERVDVPSLRHLVDFLVNAGVHGIWAMGTTGEFACLPEAERARAVEATVEQVNGRVPVIANIGDGSTGLALMHARHAAQAGADALALTPPHYYPHSMDEMLVHFRALKHAHPDLPLFIYNIPQTVKVKMALGTTVQLAREGTVQGIKDSQNDLRWFRMLVQSIRAEGLEDQFRMFLGTRILIDAGAVIGAHGAIPATSNVAPAASAEAWDSAIRGDFPSAQRAVEVVAGYEDLVDIARGGSPDAASYASMKAILHDWGIIANPRLTRPLRSLAADELPVLRERLKALPHGAERVGALVAR